MAVIFDGALEDENGNIFRPHSNSKTSVYSNEKTEANTTGEALDELYEKVEDASGIVNLTQEEYDALTNEEKINGKVYFVEDAEEEEETEETEEASIPVATEVVDGLMSAAYVKTLNSLTPKISLTLTTESKELFGTEVVCSFVGKESIIGAFNSKGVCSIALPYIGTYVIKTVDGGTNTLVAEDGGEYSLLITALPKTVITVTTKDFANKPIVVTGPENSVGAFDVYGLYTLTVRTVGTYTLTCEGYVKSIAVTELETTIKKEFNRTIIYGFHIDETESDPDSAVTYLKDADGLIPAYMDYTTGVFNYGSWENAFFMPRPCMLKNDGTVDYYLDKDDYKYKDDGTTSDISAMTYEGNAMMEWGKDGNRIWVKVDTTSDGCSATSPTIYIANEQVDDTYKAYSFINNQGELVDHFYTCIYEGSSVNGKLRSLSSQSCSVLTTALEEITLATANNTDDVLWHIGTFSDRCLINYLLILMSKSLDVQTAFGNGYTESNSTLLSTGSMNARGLFWGENTGKYGVKVFGMENYWGNVCSRIAGLVNVKGNIYSKMTYGTQDGSTAEGYNLTGSGYNDTGIALSDSSEEYIIKNTFSVNGIVPSKVGATSSTYYCDYTLIGIDDTFVGYVGGDLDSSVKAGAFNVDLNLPALHADDFCGTGLSCKPLK